MPTAARPWPRFFARYIDVLLFASVAGILLAIFAPSFFDAINGEGKNNDAALGILVMFCWIPVEAIILAAWGATPGKAIFGIRLANRDGRNPTFPEALSRSFSVWAKGTGCGFPLINLITGWIAYRKLKATGSTSWDSRLQLSVSQVHVSAVRGLIAAALLIGLVALMIIGSLQS
ncbi:MAG TPA: RDD family protein [Candidatus Binatia bacterium]|jgi:uncharacterized RDD family membrane protein YckC|nr:RDD family protein [Candidatus Binatia bacterium]